MLRVYIAGPISKGDVKANITRGIETGVKMLKDGMCPYIPHMNGKLKAYDPFPDWAEGVLDYEVHWLDVCDVLFRLDGESAGADHEVRYAKAVGIPVYYEDEYAQLVKMATETGPWTKMSTVLDQQREDRDMAYD